jgi:diguanylate cyclase (GGDEF)-like protein
VSGEARVGSSNGATGDRATEADRQSARDRDQTALDTDQTLSDADHTASDAEQALADSDRTGLEHDEVLASADQRASNRDQLAADRELAEGPPAGPARRRVHEATQAVRRATTADRAETAVLRARTAAERLDAGDRRDEASRLRDLAALARDRAADERDRIAAQTEPVGPAAEARAQAAADRARAAADRERAAAEREQAAADRQEVRDALSEAHFDELTGTYRRGLGSLELEREINRARHSGGGLVLACIDVDGLKEVNDRDGHAAGDALLVAVVATIRSKLRSYDPIVRFGGDEFICAFSDFNLEGVRQRFDEIGSALGETHEGRSISVGLAELGEGDRTLDDLTARGDAALYEQKRRRNEERRRRNGYLSVR